MGANENRDGKRGGTGIRTTGLRTSARVKARKERIKRSLAAKTPLSRRDTRKYTAMVRAAKGAAAKRPPVDGVPIISEKKQKKLKKGKPSKNIMKKALVVKEPVMELEMAVGQFTYADTSEGLAPVLPPPAVEEKKSEPMISESDL